MDIKLTGRDMDLANGLLTFVTGKDAIAQHVTMRLRTFLTETVYDRSAGVPYFQVIFGVKNPNVQGVEFIIQDTVNKTPGVISSQLTSELDSNTRELQITGTIQSVDGEIDFSELIRAAP
jgi:hypothetical protein